jgi:glycosyltransferase involved in cell wall biosynthesis
MTPKGGLLAAIAAYMARVPIRFHTFTGQRWETLKGPKRSILIVCDWIIGQLSTHCFADSPSQAEYLVKMGIVRKDRISSIHMGSFAGVDFERFNFEQLRHQRDENRKALGIARDDVVICFVGRIVKDKGIEELIDAFTTLAATNQDLVLLLVGPVEELGNRISEKTISIMRNSPRIIAVGGVNNPEYYLSASDIFCLPSYREGFGTVILEAAAMKIPTVATQITGIVDAIEDGKTGILVEPRNASSLGKALGRLINDSNFRMTLGNAAYERTLAFYRTEILVDKTLEVYNSALNRDRRPFLQ